jgi:hypothetical protein
MIVISNDRAISLINVVSFLCQFGWSCRGSVAGRAVVNFVVVGLFVPSLFSDCPCRRRQAGRAVVVLCLGLINHTDILKKAKL